jgi:hypothetical protein
MFSFRYDVPPEIFLVTHDLLVLPQSKPEANGGAFD